MEIKQFLYQHNPWWDKNHKPEPIIEPNQVLSALYPPIKTPGIIILTGLRRAGKTITMKCLIRHLIKKEKIPPENCLYVSIGDYQLSSLSIAESR
jgi:predicted AAA+ superfamily ATPase